MKIAYRSPKIFKYGGWFIRLWGKWYRLVRIGEY